jgi:catechol 2,3-dioxygenase-like lactoylglutathione lyase family enzyme
MINIRHTGIVVSDAEKSIDFYTNLLGFEIKKDMMESGDYTLIISPHLKMSGYAP